MKLIQNQPHPSAHPCMTTPFDFALSMHPPVASTHPRTATYVVGVTTRLVWRAETPCGAHARGALGPGVTPGPNAARSHRQASFGAPAVVRLASARTPTGPAAAKSAQPPSIEPQPPNLACSAATAGPTATLSAIEPAEPAAVSPSGEASAWQGQSSSQPPLAAAGGADVSSRRTAFSKWMRAAFCCTFWATSSAS